MQTPRIILIYKNNNKILKNMFHSIETLEFIRLVEQCRLTVKRQQISHFNSSVLLLKNCLVSMYGCADIVSLIKNGKSLHECRKFNDAMINTLENSKCSKSSSYSEFSHLKKILLTSSIDTSFISKLTLIKKNPKTEEDELIMLIPKRYRIMSGIGPYIKQLVTNLRKHSNIKSTKSIKLFMYFIFNKLFPNCSLTISTITETKIPIVKEWIENYPNFCSMWKRWVCLFFEIHKVDASSLLKLKSVQPTLPDTFWIEGDRHKISCDDLEKIYNAAETTLEKLCFLLMITTGMRVSGLTRIKLEHIILKRDNDFDVKEHSKTLEKGNKWFCFFLIPQIQCLIKKWILEERMVNSIYLFPSHRYSDKPICTTTISKLFKRVVMRANLVGKQFHLHSLRHSYAHILLNCGNSVDVVSKLLNHSSPATTEKFYLRESVIEIVNRANIPWLKKNTPTPCEMPDFLKRFTLS
jgi:integrase